MSLVKYPIQVTNPLRTEELESVKADIEKKGIPYGIAEVGVITNSDGVSTKAYVLCRAVTEKDRKDKEFMKYVMSSIKQVPRSFEIEWRPNGKTL